MNMKRLRLMRDAARVQRLHTMAPCYQQSVGEHTFGVIALLYELGVEPSAGLIRAALYHDVVEAATGDMPAPAKWRYPNLEAALREVEADIMEEYDVPVKDITEQETRLLKFADLMELALFCIEECDRGDKRMETIAVNCLDAIEFRGLETVTTEALELFKKVTKKVRYD